MAVDHAVLVVEPVHAAVPARPGDRPGERAAREPRSIVVREQRHLGTGVRKFALLRGRGRAVHQRPRRRARRVFRRAQRSTRRSTAERAARGWRLELRGGARLGALVVPHDDLRARRTARVRAGVRRHAGGDATRGGARTSISSSVVCSDGCRPARSSSRRGRSSRFRRSGTTTCCARSTICARPACRPDARVEEAVAIVRERRQDDGRWLLDVRHRDTLHEEWLAPSASRIAGSRCGRLRVLAWYGRRD